MIGPESVFTPSWLSRVMGAPVTGVRVEALPPELCLASTVARLHLTGEGAPATVMGKLAGAADLRELRFYRELAADSGIAVPRFYGGEVVGDCVAMVIEDLGGLRLGDYLRGCSQGDAERVVDLLAGLHRRFWAAPVVGEDWLPTYGDIAVSIARLPQRLPRFEAGFGAGVDAGLLAATRAVDDSARHWLERVARRYTLLHVDSHLDNLAFDDQTGRAVLFDWQTVAAGSPMVDLAHFVVGSLAVDHRRRAEDGLLERYHRALDVRDYSRAELEADYCAAVARRWIGNVNGMGRPEAASFAGRQAELAVTGVQRWAAAMLDHRIAL